MNKILLIEDSMMISRALSANIRKELNVEVDSAYTLADAKARLAESHEYFAALVDLTLPDAPDGEALEGDALDDTTVHGVVTHFLNRVDRQEGDPIPVM